MANEDNLIPLDDRCKEDATRIRQKGAYSSHRARRKKADFNRAAQELLQLQMPPGEMRTFLDTNGIEPTMENALIFAALFEGIKKGDINAVMKLREITRQNKDLDDRKEQKTRIAVLEKRGGLKSESANEEHINLMTDLVEVLRSPDAPERNINDLLGKDVSE